MLFGTLAAAGACSSFASSAGPGAAIDDAGVDEAASPDGAAAPPAGDGGDAGELGGVCAGSAQRAESLWVIGGIAPDASEPAEVLRAHLCQDGRVGPWVVMKSPILAFSVAHPAAAFLQDSIIVMGGLHGTGGPVSIDKVFTAVPSVGGGFGPFVASAAKGAADRWRVLYASDGKGLFVIGGEQLPPADPPAGLSRVDRVSRSGTTGAVEVSAQVAIPAVVARGAAVFRENQILVFAGGPSGTIYAADLDTDGAISSWVSAPGTYQESDHAAVVSGGDIYLLGGIGRPRSITAVVVDGSGTLSVQPTSGPVLPRATSAAAAVAVGGFVYVVGGAGPSGADVFYGRLGLAMTERDFVAGPPLPVARQGHALLAF